MDEWFVQMSKANKNVIIFACSQLCLVAFNHIGDALGINVVYA